MLPHKKKQRRKLDRRLGIKSSIPNPNQIFAAIYFIWRGMGKPEKLEYCDSATDNSSELKIDSDIFETVNSYWNQLTQNVPTDFKDLLEDSGLFKSQIEPLQVLLSLFWKIGKISFLDESYPDTNERTGGKRFIKKIEFTINLDLLDLTLLDSKEDDINDETFETLTNWLKKIPDTTPISEKLKLHLAALSEDTHFKHTDGVFLQEGIYESIITNNEPVELQDELKGPLRILNSVISKDLHPILRKEGGGINLKQRYDERYIRKIAHLLDLLELENDGDNTGIVEDTVDTDQLPRNLILYGAPGTGKSYELKSRQEKLNPEYCQRITFYSDYSYSQFVGGYKPVPIYEVNESISFKSKSSENIDRPGSPTIEYSFVEGPLLRTYVDAKNNPEKNYLLIIEELNRADTAAVFGDFFQLLDRAPDGVSEYSIVASKEAIEFLLENGIKEKEISLPSNLYIWATLNSADQGVFAIDTAFKRRWEFEYLPIDQNQYVVEKYSIKLTTKREGTDEEIDISWNDLRHRINKKLSKIGIQEDLMIGPFFLTKREMHSDSAFEHKLLAYLRDDILRHQHDEFFNISGTLGEIIQEYKKGINIFSFELE